MVIYSKIDKFQTNIESEGEKTCLEGKRCTRELLVWR